MTWRRMTVSVVLQIWILSFALFARFLQALDCGYPGSPAFGRPHPVKERYRPGDAVSFTCAHGYALQGPLQRVCLPDGTWGGRLPLCDRSLSSLEQHASSTQTLSLYPASKAVDGDPLSCTYTDKIRPRWIRVDLRQNHRIRAVAITIPKGIYSQDAAQLTIYAISVRDSTTASYHKCASFNGKFASSTLQLSCASGEVEGRYVHVEDNRHKVDYFSLCEIQVFVNKGSYECGEAERPAHSYSVRTETGAVNYRCIYGYRLDGPTTRLCQQDGQWSLPQPTCVEVLCLPLDPVSHGRLLYISGSVSRPTLGTTVNVSCDYGYQLAGNITDLTCGEDGKWGPLANISCQAVDCGSPPIRNELEQVVLLNGTRYGGVALLRCQEEETTIICREDGTWSTPIEMHFCREDENIGLSRLGLVEEEESDVPTGIVIGMAVVVFFLLVAVVLVLLLKRRKVLSESNSMTDSKENSSTPYENDGFYATIPSSKEDKKNFMSTVLFPKKKEDTSLSNGCIYEEIGGTQPKTTTTESKVSSSGGEAVYAQVNLGEKRRLRLVKRFEPVDPPEWEGGTYRSEGVYDEDVDLEPIKLRELPPIPRDDEGEVTYACLSLPLDPPPSAAITRNNDIYESSDVPHQASVMKDNELYTASTTLKV